MQNNPMPENIIPWLQNLQKKIDALQTRETGTIYVNEQIVSIDPITGVKTILGDLGGRTGLQQWVGDTEPPAVPTMPYVIYSAGGYTITWDGEFEDNEEKTPDFAHCKIYGTNGILVAYVGTLINTNDTAPYSDIVMNDSWSFWLASVDENGNESGPGEMSPSILATPFVEIPDIKEALDSIDDSVQAAKDAATQATAAANLASNALQAAKEAVLLAIGAEAGKGGVILSEDQPTDPAYLDGNWLWINESAPKINHDGNPDTPSISPPFVYNGANWVQSADPAIIDATADVITQSSLAQQAFDKAVGAAEAAGNAQLAANSKNTIWYNTPPVDGEHQVGDTWFDSSDDNKVKVWDGNSWETKRDQLLTQVNDDLTGVKTTVGSKNASYFTPSEPQGTTEIPLVRGDLWFDIDDEYKLHTYDGTDWQVTQDTAGAIATAADDAAAKDVLLKQAALTEAAQTAQTKADNAAALIENRAISRGTDLITNGTGILGTNYNFSTFTYDAADAPAGASGSFVIGSINSSAGRGPTSFSDESIPVSTGKAYIQSVYIREQNEDIAPTLGYVGLVPQDGLGRSISPQMYAYDAETETTLSAPLNPGDTSVAVTAINGTWQSLSNHDYLGIWNWQDESGKVWPIGTYTRLYPRIDSISGTTITLEAPYNGPAMPAGTPVTNNLSGGTYMYVATGRALFTSEWVKHSGIVGPGVHDGTTQLAATDKFPFGTASARLLFLPNYDGAAGSSQAYAALSLSDATAAYEEAQKAFKEADDAHKEAGAASELAGAALNAATHTGQNLFDDDPPSGTAPKGTMWFQNNLKGTVLTAPPQAIIGMWQQVDGTAPVLNADGTVTNAVEGGNWQKREVSNEVIGNLDAGTITFGTMSGDRIEVGSLVIGSVNGLQDKVDTYDITTNTVTGFTNEAGQVVATNITGTLSTDTIPELAQSKITDLSTVAQNASDANTKVTDWTDPVTGGVKATVVDGELATVNIPELGTDKVTGLSTIASNASTAKGKVDAWVDTVTGGVKATVINGALKTTNIPALDPSKVTGLPAVVTKATNADTLTQLWKTPGTNVTTINGGTIATGTVQAEKLGATIIEAGYIKSSFLDSVAIRGKLIMAELIDAKEILVEGSITAESALIGSINASKITVGEMSGIHIKGKTISADKLIVASSDNLVVDPYFENVDLTDHRIAVSTGVWTKGVSSVDGMAYVTASVATGQQAFKLHASETYEYSEVIPEKKYRIKFQSNVMSGSAGVRPAVRVVFADGQIGYFAVDQSEYTTVSTSAWRWISYTWTAPANAVAASFDLQSSASTGQVNFKTPTVTGMGDGELIVDGAITALKIDTDAVTADKIKANAVTAVKINARAVTSDKIEANAINGKTITGAIIQTKAVDVSNIKLDSLSNTLKSWDSNGNPTFTLDANTGFVSIKGNFTTRSATTDGTMLSAGIDLKNEPSTAEFMGLPGKLGDSVIQLWSDTGFSGDAVPGEIFASLVNGYPSLWMMGASVSGLPYVEDRPYFNLGFDGIGRKQATISSDRVTINGWDFGVEIKGKLSIGQGMSTYGDVFIDGTEAQVMRFGTDSQNRTIFRNPDAAMFGFANLGGGWSTLEAGPATFWGKTNINDTLTVRDGHIFSGGGNMIVQGNGAQLDIGADGSGKRISSDAIYNRTYSSSPNVYVTSFGTIGRGTSLSKYKVAIDDQWLAKDNWRGIKNLKPVTFYDKGNLDRYVALVEGEEVEDAEYPTKILGLIAEDVVETMPILATYDDTNSLNGVAYDRGWIALHPWLLEHDDEIENLKKEIAELKALLK